MVPSGKFEEEALAALQWAVTRALERKRRLGQYAVFWEDGRVIFDGPDAPTEQEEPVGGGRVGLGSAAPLCTECLQTGTKRSRS